MRDIVLFLLVVGGIPFILRNPAVGIFYWVWISLMNPHRSTWGFAYSFPFAYVIAITTVIALVISRQPRQLKGGAASYVLLAFVIWMCFTTFFALEPERAVVMAERVMKILFVTFLGLFALNKRRHATWLVLIVVFSIGFHAVKGGVFTLATSGDYRVFGPPETFIEDNNSLALAVTMTIPLMAYLYIMSNRRLVRVVLAVSMALCAISVFGSYSRGGLLAIAAMSGFLLIKSKHKVGLGLIIVLLGVVFYSFMPPAWEDRMASIGAYEEDSSAQGRLSTWTMLLNLALDRPVFGGGFEPYTEEVFRRYLPDYGLTHSAHSIYFQVLGEHGFIGLALFLLFWALTWQLARRIIKCTRGAPEQKWAYWLATTIQVSLIGYFVGGAFLNLAYWDMPYFLMIALAVTWHVVRNESRVAAKQADSPGPAHAPHCAST